jgi:hypothetical protein
MTNTGLLSVDNYAIIAGWWLRCALMIHMKKGYCDIIIYDPSILTISDDDIRTILGKLSGAHKGGQYATRRDAMILDISNNIPQISSLVTQSNVLAYLIRLTLNEKLAIITSELAELDTVMTDIPQQGSSDPGRINTVCRRYLALKTKGFYSMLADMFRGIQDITDTYTNIHNKLKNMVPRWRKDELNISNIIAVMRSVIPPPRAGGAGAAAGGAGAAAALANDENRIIGAWLTYLPLTDLTFNRTRAIERVVRQLSPRANSAAAVGSPLSVLLSNIEADNIILHWFLKYTAFHQRLDTSSMPTIGFGQLVNDQLVVGASTENRTLRSPSDQSVITFVTTNLRHLVSANIDRVLQTANGIQERFTIHPDVSLSTESVLTLIDRELAGIVNIIEEKGSVYDGNGIPSPDGITLANPDVYSGTLARVASTVVNIPPPVTATPTEIITPPTQSSHLGRLYAVTRALVVGGAVRIRDCMLAAIHTLSPSIVQHGGGQASSKSGGGSTTVTIAGTTPAPSATPPRLLHASGFPPGWQEILNIIQEEDGLILTPTPDTRSMSDDIVIYNTSVPIHVFKF